MERNTESAAWRWKAWVAGLCLIAAAIVIFQSWTSRFLMNPDGISYVDMADRLVHDDLSPLTHTYWSPLYPCLLSVALRLHPGMTDAVLAAHLVNALIGLIAIAGFTFFLMQYFAWRNRGVDGWRAEMFCLSAFAYAVLIWSTTEGIGLELVSPDVLVTVMVFCAAGCVCRLEAFPTRWLPTSVLLGAILGIGCIVKSALLPLSASLLGMLAIRSWFSVALRKAVGVAVFTCLLIAVPYAIAMQVRQGQPFGVTGKLNYAWLVDASIPIAGGWTGQANTGTPVHSPHLLSENPPVFVFEDSPPSTFAMWYDPGYFHQGLQVKFSVLKEFRTVMSSAIHLRAAFGGILLPLLAGFFTLLYFGSRREAWARLKGSASLIIFCWCASAFALYAAVAVDPRYTAGFAALLCFVLYDGLCSRLPAGLGCRGAITAIALCILLIDIHHLSQPFNGRPGSDTRAHLAVASELQRLGLRPGDEIAVTGFGFDAYYAMFARLRIVATIGWPGGSSGIVQGAPFDDEHIARIASRLRGQHIKAIISHKNDIAAGSRSWKCVAGAGYCVLLL